VVHVLNRLGHLDAIRCHLRVLQAPHPWLDWRNGTSVGPAARIAATTACLITRAFRQGAPGVWVGVCFTCDQRRTPLNRTGVGCEALTSAKKRVGLSQLALRLGEYLMLRPGAANVHLDHVLGARIRTCWRSRRMCCVAHASGASREIPGRIMARGGSQR
jgi:hypothetical protein